MQFKNMIQYMLMLIIAAMPASAAVDTDMKLNNGGFISYDPFLAEVVFDNSGQTVANAQIFGVLEIYGEFYFWPDFTAEVDLETQDIVPGESRVVFLDFVFPDIDDVIPFGPMTFWGAYVVDPEDYGYDFEEFWLDEAHKWTPTPNPSATQTNTPVPTGSATATPTPFSGGWSDISGNLPTPVGSRGFLEVFAYENSVWAASAGSEETIFYSNDGGESFTSQDNEFGTWTYAIHMLDGENGYSAGVGGIVYKTTNSGAVTSLSSIAFPISSEGWVCGGNTIRHYTDGVWNADQSYPSGGYNCIFFLPGTTQGWCVGDIGRNLHTTDGLTWQSQPNPDPDPKSLNSVFFLNSSEGRAGGHRGTALHTINGGVQWELIDLGTDEGLAAVHFTSAGVGYIVGVNNTIFKFSGSGRD